MRKTSASSGANYALREDGTFIINNYNHAKTFSSFFPGIAGTGGIPMWVFYVNRGQCISTFGIKNKNYSMLEFYAADKAYAFTQNLGFRTFIKIAKKGKIELYEPFQVNAANTAYKTSQKMLIKPHELVLEEVNVDLGFKTTVRYFTVPGEPFAALGRAVSFENLRKAKLDFEVIDGLPRVIPYWMSEYILKEMSTTHQAWAEVLNLEKNGVPYYKVKVELADSSEVVGVEKGNFYFGIAEEGAKCVKARSIVDPELVFGSDTSFNFPFQFAANQRFSVSAKQNGDNKYPSAMSFFKVSLKPAAKSNFYSLTGHIDNVEKLNRLFKEAGNPAYFEEKIEQNRKAIEEITDQVYTKSAIKEFDLYCRQTYLDNILRGGMPVMLPTGKTGAAGSKELPYYVYWRKHGDLERDYNDFQVSPSYYSQGTANYRDVNQNRRNDLFFNPKVGDFNIVRFYNLLQLDGYNPLIVDGSYFVIDEPGSASELVESVVESMHSEQMKQFVSKPFEPGSILLYIEEKNIKLKVSKDEFLRRILGASRRIDDAQRYTEGFWTDHWTYNIDLLESYISVFPEKEKEILLEKKEFTYFDNDHVVLPRSGKYVDAGGGKVRQFGSTHGDKAKLELIKQRKSEPNKVRIGNGKGEVYRTTLLEKMINLLVNKLASLDSEGIGIEAEANKPSWYDALNGLPGVFGSCTPETFELKRMAVFLQDKIKTLNLKDDFKISVHEEMKRFFDSIGDLLGTRETLSSFDFWDKAVTLKEGYRKETLFGLSGKQEEIKAGELSEFLRNAVAKINKGIDKAYDPGTGLYHTYIAYEAKDITRTGKMNGKGQEFVSVGKFDKRPLPLFLEGQVHYIKTEQDKDKIRTLHRSVKKSGLYDKVLGMYKVNASLKNEPYDIGRCTVFSPGWLENESIWLHMEYKYLLELLKAGLNKEFFAEFKKAGVCFLKPKTYGRSIMENSSFIASSVFPDKNQWGRGFVARLSGSTAEFVEMWLCMTSGRAPFRLDGSGKLTLEFKPAIAKEFFDKSGKFQFMFLGKTLVTYHNSKKIDTWNESFAVKKIDILWNEGRIDNLNGKAIGLKLAERIRGQEAKSIDIYF